MTHEETEFLNAYDELTTIISEDDFHAFQHKFFRSYHADYEYTYHNVCILMKCDNPELRIEMFFYNLDKECITDTFAFRFTQCGAYYEWLEHFTKIRFKELHQCKESYGRVRVRPELISSIETYMKDRDDKIQDAPYKWI